MTPDRWLFFAFLAVIFGGWIVYRFARDTERDEVLRRRWERMHNK